MTTIRKNPINSSNFANFGEPKVVKMYDDTPKENVAEAMGTTVEGLKPQHQVIFERNPQILPTDTYLPPAPEQRDAPGESENASNQTELTPEQERNERRSAFKRAADVEQRARQMQKQAQEELKKLEQFKQFMSTAQKDPTAVAKALGMDPTEFLRQYQNAMFSIPNDPPKPAPEEDVKTRLERYEEERRKEKEELQQFKSQSIRNEYIQSKILPVIQSDVDKYELLNQNGKEQCASFIYDMMDAHYRATGEELNPQDVAEEMENQLTKEFEEKLASTKKLKRFSKHFRTDTDAPGEEITIPGSLGEDAAIEKRHSTQENQQLGVDSPPDTSLNTRPSQQPSTRRPVNAPSPSPLSLLGQDAQANSYQRQNNMWNKKEQRIKRIEESLRAGVLPPSRNR